MTMSMTGKVNIFELIIRGGAPKVQFRKSGARHNSLRFQRVAVRPPRSSMASGFGISGGTGRCYPIWMDFSECMSNTDAPYKCRDLRDDYLECLHHRKEFTRLNAIYREEQKQKHSGGAPNAGHDGH